GLNVKGSDCQLPKSSLNWKTFYPLADTKLLQSQPRPRLSKFTTIGQWYWSGAVEVAGEFPDLSKKNMFEPYLGLPARVPEAELELAVDIHPARARGAVRTGDEYQPGRSGKGAFATAWLARCRSSPGCAHAECVSSIHGER